MAFRRCGRHNFYQPVLKQPRGSPGPHAHDSFFRKCCVSFSDTHFGGGLNTALLWSGQDTVKSYKFLFKFSNGDEGAATVPVSARGMILNLTHGALDSAALDSAVLDSAALDSAALAIHHSLDSAALDSSVLDSAAVDSAAFLRRTL